MLNGGRIVAVSDGGAAALGHAALAGGNGQTVVVVINQTSLNGGICERTPAGARQAGGAGQGEGQQCQQLLGCYDHASGGSGGDAQPGRDRHGEPPERRSRPATLDNLTGVTALDLDNNALRSFPAGIFGRMTALTELSIAYNQTSGLGQPDDPAGRLFVGLANLRTLRLEHNDLETLPDRIFEKLTNLTTLTLHGNPGSARFLPVAVAGPVGGIDAKAGEKKTLGGDAGGPWGDNLINYSWRKATGTTVELSALEYPRSRPSPRRRSRRRRRWSTS